MRQFLHVFFIIALVLTLTRACGAEDGAAVQTRHTEIILKVKPDVIVMPEGAYTASLEDVQMNSVRLREISGAFNLVSIEKMYARKAARDERYSADIDNTYLLKFPEHTDAERIAAEYKGLEDVIYAEVNRTVSIL